jgi:uncharacterized protein (TIGR03437 family)
LTVRLIGAVSLLAPAIGLAQTNTYTITTVAGIGGVHGFSGDAGTPTNAAMALPSAVAVDSSHNLYVADQGNNRIRKVAGGKISTYAGTGALGYTGDGGTATSAAFWTPTAVRTDSAGNLYIADYNNHLVRKVSTGGTITTAVGTPAGFGSDGDGGPATSATLVNPTGLAIGPDGSLYVADATTYRVRVVTPDGNINTLAGNGRNAFAGDGGPATKASIGAINGVAVDGAGNVYIADTTNHRVRRVGIDGTITTVAGTGNPGSSGDGGPATAAQLNRPWDVAVDSGGTLYIADSNNNRIRMVSPSGIISTVAGSVSSGYLGDGGLATNARLNSPTGITLDPSNGNLYIADASNECIRLLTPNPPSVSDNGVITALSFGGFTTAAPSSWIEIYGSNLAINTRGWASADFQGANAPMSLDGTSVTIGGQPAYVSYISGGQVNVQVPSNVGSGPQPLVVKTAAGSSSAYSVTVNPTEPGLLAPAAFKINGTQYATAIFTDGTYVLPPNAIAGAAARRAKAGDTVIFFGVGFGAVTPPIAAGQVVPQIRPLAGTVQISFGGTPATVTYAGLTPNSVGLYQFNVTVPSVASSDSVPVTFSLNGTAGTQTLYTAVQ